MSGIAQYYRTLELENGASPEEVKQAYKDLATVWHPDRFPNNARLQQKAQDKLKEINKAYEQLRSCRPNYHSRSYSPPPRQPQRPSQPNQEQSAPNPPQQSSQRHSASKQSQQSSQWQGASKQSQYGSKQEGSKAGKRQYDPIISLQVAKAILAEYNFRLIRTLAGRCTHYESGPFWLDIREDVPEVRLFVPCDSVGTFHRALLSIPCKSVGTFHQSEAEELIQLFRLSGAEC